MVTARKMQKKGKDNSCFRTAGDFSIIVAPYSNEKSGFWSFVAPPAPAMWTGNVGDG